MYCRLSTNLSTLASSLAIIAEKLYIITEKVMSIKCLKKVANRRIMAAYIAFISCILQARSN